MKKSPPYARVIAYGLYEGVLKEAISRFKFYGLRRLSRPLGRVIAESPDSGGGRYSAGPVNGKGIKAERFQSVIADSTGCFKKNGDTA